MKISVIIPTKDRNEDLQRCLISLAEQIRQPDEILVINGSTTAITLSSPASNIIKIIDTKPGLAHQRNQGFKASKGDLIVYLDDDVVLEHEYLEQLSSGFQDSTVNAVTGRITNLNLPTWNSPFRLILWCFNWLFQLPDIGSGNFRLSGFGTYPYLFEARRFISVLSGCNMAFRRTVLESISFDENLVGYSYLEDLDISRRVSQQYDCIYIPEARLAHHSSPKSSKELYSLKWMLGCHHLYLFRKNAPKAIINYIAFGLSIIGVLAHTLILQHSLLGSVGMLRGLIAAYQMRCPCADEIKRRQSSK